MNLCDLVPKFRRKHLISLSFLRIRLFNPQNMITYADIHNLCCRLSLSSKNGWSYVIFLIFAISVSWTKYQWNLWFWCPPNIDFSSKTMIFPNFESLYLHDYWSDFKKFTHKTYLHTERRRFSIVSQRKNKNKISFESSLHREILKFQFSDLHHPSVCFLFITTIRAFTLRIACWNSKNTPN